MKKHLPTVAGIVGSLAAGCTYCLLEADHDPGTAALRIQLLMGIVSSFFIGFLVPYEAAGLLMFSPEERRRHACAASNGWQGFEAFTGILLFAGHVGLLVHSNYSSIQEWALAAVFLVVFFRAARAYLQNTGPLSHEAPNQRIESDAAR